MTTRDPDRCPTHPGAVLREDILPAIGRPKAEVARLLGISRRHLHDIISEKRPIRPRVAVALGKMFGAQALFWTRMQAAHDTWRALHEVDVSAVPRLTAGGANRGHRPANRGSGFPA